MKGILSAFMLVPLAFIRAGGGGGSAGVVTAVTNGGGLTLSSGTLAMGAATAVQLTGAALPTCDASSAGKILADSVSAGETNRNCFCELDGASGSYFWRNLATAVRGTATVCPSTDAYIPVNGAVKFFHAYCTAGGSWTAIGGSAPTPVGTGAASAEADGDYCKATTSNANPSASGYTSSLGAAPLHDLLVTQAVKTGPNAADTDSGTGTYIGPTDSTPSTASPTTANLAMFRYFPNGGSDGTAFWRTITCGGTACTTTTTSVAVASDTAYLLQVRVNATQALFYINHALVARHTTNLPTSTTAIHPYALVRQFDTNGARIIKNVAVSVIDRRGRP